MLTKTLKKIPVYTCINRYNNITMSFSQIRQHWNAVFSCIKVLNLLKRLLLSCTLGEILQHFWHKVLDSKIDFGIDDCL